MIWSPECAKHARNLLDSYSFLPATDEMVEKTISVFVPRLSEKQKRALADALIRSADNMR